MGKRRLSGTLKTGFVMIVIMLSFFTADMIMGGRLFSTEVFATDGSSDISASITDEKLRQILQILANYEDKTGASFYSLVADPYTTDITVMPEAEGYKGAVSRDVLEKYTGEINLAPYNITDISGINYAIRASEVVLPENLTTIKGKAFYEMTKLTKVIMPETVTSIDSSAFEKCEKLDNVITYSDDPAAVANVQDKVLHLEKVKTIGDSAFASCLAVREVKFYTPETSEPGIDIKSNAFKSCTSLESADVPKGTLGTGIFSSCRNMTSVSFDDSYTKIPDNTLTDIEPAAGLDIHFPTALKEIGYYACEGSRIKSMNLEDCAGLKQIGDYAFQNTKIICAVDLFNNAKLTTICQHVFAGAVFTHGDVRLPDSVTSMGISAFFATSGLTSINIPKNLPSIPDGTFMCSYDLGQVIVPDDAVFTRVGDHAFDMCGSLSDLGFLSKASHLTEIGEYAFARCIPKKADFKPGEDDNIGLKTITVPATVTKIGASAFENDFLVTTADLSGDGLVEIPNRLMMCENKNAVTLNDVSLTDPISKETSYYYFSKNEPWYKNLRSEYSGYTSISNLSSLKNVILSSSLLLLGDYAFFGNTALEATTYPGEKNPLEGLRFASSLSSVGAYAFAGCSKHAGSGDKLVITGISKVTFPDASITFGESVFRDDFSLDEVKLPYGLDSIPAHCFDGCGYDDQYDKQHHYSGLRLISELVRLRSIGDYAFNNCYCLKKVKTSSGEDGIEFGRPLEYLGSYSFAGTDIERASSLSITSVNKILPYTFDKCRSLTIINCPDSLAEIGDYAFKDCPSLLTINFPVYATLSAKMLVNNIQNGLTLTPTLGRYRNTRYRIPAKHTIDLPANAFARFSTEKISQLNPDDNSEVELSFANPRFFTVAHENNQFKITGGDKKIEGTAVRISATVPFNDSLSRTMNIDYPVDVVSVHADSSTVKFESGRFKLDNSSTGFTVKDSSEGGVLFVGSNKTGHSLTIAASALSEDPVYPGMITDPVRWEVISGTALELRTDSIIMNTGAEECISSAVFDIKQAGEATVRVYFDDETQDPPSRTMKIEVVDPIKSVDFTLASMEEAEGKFYTLNMPASPVPQTDTIIAKAVYTNENDDRDFITYKSSDSSIVSVDDTGKITALKAGRATITLGTATANTSRSLSVTVKGAGEVIEPLYVKITGPKTGDKGLAYVGERAEFTASCLPAYASQDVTWSVRDSDSANADLKNEGGKAVITGKTANSDVQLTAKAGSSTTSSKRTLTVRVLQKTVSLEFKENDLLIGAGTAKHMKLSSNQTQSGGIVRIPETSRENVTFTSSDETVLCLGKSSSACTEKEVTLTGTSATLYYKGLKEGTTYITAKAESGAQVKLKVTVKDLITGLVCNNKSIKLTKGASEKMNLTRTPASSTEDVTFESSNTSVATVNADGTIKAVASGTARVTARSTIGGKSVSCSVTVLEDEAGAPGGNSSGSTGQNTSGDSDTETHAGQTFTLKNKKYIINKDSTLTLTGISGSGKKIVIPEAVIISEKTYKVTKIGPSAFAGNTSMTSLTIGSNVTVIEDNAFMNCTSLKKVKMGKRVRKIGRKAFRNCKSMKKLTIGSGVKTIGNMAISNCTSLTSLVIGINVTSIGTKACYKCKSLKYVDFKSKKIKKIGKGAFITIKQGAVFKCYKIKLKAYDKLLKKSGKPKKSKLRKR